MNKPQKKSKSQANSKNQFSQFIKQEIAHYKQGEKRLLTDFLSGITVMLVTILLIVGLALINAVQKLDDEIYSKTSGLQNIIANNVATDILNNYSNDLSATNRSIASMVKNKLIAYCVITNKQNSQILLTTLPGTKIIDNKIAKETLEKNKLKNTKCLLKTTDKYNMFIGFNEDMHFIEQIKQFDKKFAGLLIVCLFLGLWLAYGLCRRVMKPIGALVKVTSSFSGGDLSERLEKTKYVEFNELVDSYNSMADYIQRLYSSLEQKVNERTKQLNVAIKELQSTQAMMVHSEKMKSLGELVAGIMHEINNPVNFIYGNLSHLKNYSSDMISLIDSFDKYKDDLTEEHRKEYEQMLKDVDYEFLKDDLPDLIKSCHEGTERTKNIILNLKDFSRMEESAITNVDLPKEIDSTLNILNNKFKNKITVHKDYRPNVPKIEAYGGQLNQVFMNILDNAAFAVSEKDHGDVWITIRKDVKYAYIEIQDNGKGMSEETKQKIFNPFFTTKPVGQGTGLGLSISYKVIKNHNGSIDVISEQGKGTKFIIKIPLVFVKQQEVKDGKNTEAAEVTNGNV